MNQPTSSPDRGKLQDADSQSDGIKSSEATSKAGASATSDDLSADKERVGSSCSVSSVDKSDSGPAPVLYVPLSTLVCVSNVFLRDEPSSAPSADPSRTTRQSSERTDDNKGLRIRNASKHLEALRELKPNGVVLLLTPEVAPLSPEAAQDEDPYEYFGRAIAKHNLKVSHVPYKDKDLATSIHYGHIKLAAAVVVVANDLKVGESTPHIDFVNQVNVMVDDSPLLVVLTNKSPELWDAFNQFALATLIQVPDYSKASLKLAASVMFGED